MDEAGQEIEKGKWSEITQMKTSRNGEKEFTESKEGRSWLGYKRTRSSGLGLKLETSKSYRTRSA